MTYNVTKRKIMYMRLRVNVIDSRQQVEKVNGTKSWFFVRINKIGKPLAGSKGRERKLSGNQEHKGT